MFPLVKQSTAQTEDLYVHKFSFGEASWQVRIDYDLNAHFWVDIGTCITQGVSYDWLHDSTIDIILVNSTAC